ncbi:hypothetical protein [Mucilaginibacter aquariorum]|uniref:Uncharacterized protein n=1 Tax=Mucilaginibacter aquariorum TaxID=2967225 RepID=A0ABT1T5P0_9SPHI|nr:hypothetical protein [Mucilaginibacter aquariorum]MCQ6959954.1 hypothetical protein [Mucilaginibacter aquariorum]
MPGDFTGFLLSFPIGKTASGESGQNDGGHERVLKASPLFNREVSTFFQPG